MNLPWRLPWLSAGRQPPGSDSVCAMQAINWLVSGRDSLGDETDASACVQPIMAEITSLVNDWLPDDRRQELWPIILRLPGTARPDMEPDLSVRIAAFCADRAARVCEPDTAAAQAASLAADRAAAAAQHAAAAAQHAAEGAHASAIEQARYAVAGAVVAVSCVDDDEDGLLQLLSDAIAFCEQVTGHVPPQPDIARIERLGELVGTRQVETSPLLCVPGWLRECASTQYSPTRSPNR
jgi:hypothetical protein